MIARPSSSRSRAASRWASSKESGGWVRFTAVVVASRTFFTARGAPGISFQLAGPGHFLRLAGPPPPLALLRIVAVVENVFLWRGACDERGRRAPDAWQVSWDRSRAGARVARRRVPQVRDVADRTYGG